MVNCKFFREFFYLSEKNGRNIIIIQTKGVMAARLGESHKSKEEKIKISQKTKKSIFK